MARVQVQHGGQTYEIDVPEGQDVASAVADFEASVGVEPAVAPGPLQSAVRGFTGADADDDGQRSLGESVQRGLGLTGRMVAGAAPKALAGAGDLLSGVLNLVPAGADVVNRAFGGEGVDYRLPTNRVATIDEALSEIFPEPQGLLERVTQTGGEVALTGGGGGLALARQAPKLKAVPNLVDDAVGFFRTNPGAATAAEFTGGAGAQAGGELAEDAGLNEAGQFAASLVGGLGGAVAPTAGVRGAGAVVERARRAVEPVTPGGAERRAARELQRRAADPKAAAEAARNAPEGVTPARATEDPNLRRLERTALEDKPQLADEIDQNLAGAEQRTIEEFTKDLPAGQDPVEWQRKVVTRAAPEGTVITGTQPDEMLNEAFDSFRAGYAEADGYPIQTQLVQVEGGNVGMPELIASAVSDRKVLARGDVRESVEDWVTANFEDVASRGEPITTQADEAVVQFDSRDMLDFRQTIRAEQRRQQSAGRTNPDAAAQAKLLANVDKAITEALESQLPESASNNLRALDARYSDFKTVEDAVLRGANRDLTPQQLEQSIKMQSGSRSAVARGDTGELGDIAETGRDVTTFLGKNGKQDQAVQRAMRDMSDEQAAAARADITRELARRGSKSVDGEPRLNGEKLLSEIENNRSTLKAAGFTDPDITRIEQIAKRLRMMQSKDPRPDTQLIDDSLSMVAGLLSRVAGAKIARNIVKRTGTGGPGALTLTGFTARALEKAFGNLSISRAEQILTDAMTDKELFAALMTRSTAPEVKQAKARRVLNAWISQAASTDEDE